MNLSRMSVGIKPNNNGTRTTWTEISSRSSVEEEKIDATNHQRTWTLTGIVNVRLYQYRGKR